MSFGGKGLSDVNGSWEWEMGNKTSLTLDNAPGIPNP